MGMMRQHLIDPEICIRCYTCEEICPIDAISHDDNNVVVDAGICNGCMDCIAPCPTGSIDNWRNVLEPYSLDEQLAWDELPGEAAPDAEAPAAQPRAAGGGSEAGEDEVAELLRQAHAGQGGRALPPFSAAHPYVNIYTRARSAVARVAGNYRITDVDAESNTHHVVLDFGSQALPVLEGQSIGILPPDNDVRGRPHHVRLYSVASPRDGERPNHNKVALTVKREPFGVASQYLCGLERGDEVRVTGPFGNTFLMPNHPEANIIMICTGTGSAPFRAMTERRRRRNPNGPGKLLLFFGARTPGELPYFGPLRKLPQRLIDVEFAFSRLPDQPRQYVQDRMRVRAGDVAALLRHPHTFVFVCGLKGMEIGVAEAFADICREYGMDWESLLPALCDAGRYHVETY